MAHFNKIKNRISGITLTDSLKLRMAKGIILADIVLFVLLATITQSCNKHSAKVTEAQRSHADSIVRAVGGADSLGILAKQCEAEGHPLVSIVALREQGKQLRNESEFEGALKAHSEGLRLAKSLGDTLEWVQALNNVGTDYRRLGVLDIAQEYHYSALKMSEECSDTSFTAKKNRVVSLNGLANIYLTLGNYHLADSALRMALAGEKALNSDLGMAINYANLGSIFEKRNQTDSAWIYYRRSMEHNEKAKSTLGLALCHTSFGSLYQNAKQYGKAEAEYEIAYQLMQESKDDWHALNILVALADIHIATGKQQEAINFLNRAKDDAERINSKEHLADIFDKYYSIYKKRGDFDRALQYREKADEMQDSVVNMDKINRIQNISLSIERSRQEQRVAEVNATLQKERTSTRGGYLALVLAVLLLCVIIAALLAIYRIRSRSHKDLKQMSLMRQTFYTNITHEFRTPLTVILGLNHDLQKRDDVPADVREKAETVCRQGNSLLTLINQMLDISKIKSAVGSPDWYSGDIIAYIEMIAETYHDYAESIGLNLKVECNEQLVMDFVPDYLTKVVNNLMSNALKYTPAGGTITIAACRNGKELNVRVSDTGAGIAKEALPHLFDPFYQAGKDSDKIGTGVGLALVKSIINDVGGTITVDSTEGKGTTFFFTAPIHHNSKQKIEASNIEMHNMPILPVNVDMPKDDENDSECRILVVEDNPDVAAYIGSQLTGNYSVVYAPDGAAGIAKAKELVPDLIITDLMMPVTDGLELCRTVKNDMITDHIPVIIVTAKITDEDRVKGLEAGADAYLAKPFNQDELKVRVEMLLEQRRKLREKFSQEVAQADDAEIEREPEINEADRRFIKKVSAEVFALMEENNFEITTLADRMCLSERQMRRKISALTGDTPNVFILKIRLRRAKKLLVEHLDYTMDKVASECGFDNYSTFYHGFKKVYGITPTEFRKQGENNSEN